MITGNTTIQGKTFWHATLKTDFQKDFNIQFPLQTTTLVGFDYRKNHYKELDTWGHTLPLNPPFNFTATQGQSASVDYVEPFVTYGYLVDQRFDFNNYGGISGGFQNRLFFCFWSWFKTIHLPSF